MNETPHCHGGDVKLKSENLDDLESLKRRMEELQNDAFNIRMKYAKMDMELFQEIEEKKKLKKEIESLLAHRERLIKENRFANSIKDHRGQVREMCY